jgi:Domain of unknown function (DUF4278)
MHFQFLGTTYQHESVNIDTPKSSLFGKFRGQTYSIRCPIIVRPLPQRNLKYRGISY